MFVAPRIGPDGRPLAAPAHSDPRTAARAQIWELDKALNGLWQLGRNLIIGWAPRERGLDVVVIPHHHLTQLTRFDFDALSGSHQMDRDTLNRAGAFFRTGVIEVPLSFTPGRDKSTQRAIDKVIRRYSVTRSNCRAGILFDIVGFSLYSPLEQVAALNNLAYSLNVAHNRARANGVFIDLSRSTTGDGFYVWSRDDGVTADMNLFALMMLVLADNAIAQRKAAETAARTRVRSTQPMLRTCFHIGSHYEYFLSEGATSLNPGVNSYIVGDMTIELARMIAKALPNQILIGSFSRPNAETAVAASAATAVTTPLFISRAQHKLDGYQHMELSGEKITAIKSYITGTRVAEGYFNILKYTVTDKHGLSRDVFNAKVNIHRGNAEPIYLGLQTEMLKNFDAVEGEYLK